MNEEWRDITSYEGKYQVSNTGMVRSVDRTHTTRTGKEVKLRGKTLRPSTSKLGYKRVNLFGGDGGGQTIAVHRLVLRVFMGEPPNGCIGLHINGDPGDNRVTNLRWGTPSENMYDRSRHGTDHQRNKTTCPRGHLLAQWNLQGSKSRRGHRSCKACHQARSDKYNGSSLSFDELADMRYYMLSTGRRFPFGTRLTQERLIFEDSKDWKEK